MRVNDDGVAIVKRYEGCELKPYRCPAGLLSVGYGHVIQQNEDELLTGITQEEADQLLRNDLKSAERAVEKWVDVALNENQFSALVSFVFNVGPAAFRDSTMRRALNLRQFLAASNEFGKWVHAAGRTQPGLVKRRAAERTLFLRPVLAVMNADT